METYEAPDGSLRFALPVGWTTHAMQHDGVAVVTLQPEDASLGASLLISRAPPPSDADGRGAVLVAERFAQRFGDELRDCRRSPVRAARLARVSASVVVVEGTAPASELRVRRVIFAWLEGSALLSLVALGHADPLGWEPVARAADTILDSIEATRP